MKTPDFKPILFNTEMVKAILEGRKTQTRRIVKGVEALNVYRVDPTGDAYETLHQWNFLYGFSDSDAYYETFETIKAPCAIGDILWVRETWHKDAGRFMYKANYANDEKFYRNGKEVKITWCPSIHMPKEAARIFLRIEGIRVERLQNIENADAIFEGFSGTPCEHEYADPALGCTDCLNTGWLEPPYAEFAQLWDTTIKPADRDRYGWDANPWVWVFEFKRCKKPEGWDEL